MPVLGHKKAVRVLESLCSEISPYLHLAGNLAGMEKEDLVRAEFRFPPKLRDRLRERAAADRRSTNTMVIVLLERALDEDEQRAAAAS